MKKNFIFLPFVFVLLSFSNSIYQDGKETCKSYIPLVKGAILEYQDFDAKDKLMSTQTITIKDVVESEFLISIDIHSLMQGKKKDDITELDYTYTCENGVFKVDMESMMNQESMEGFKDMEVSMQQDNLSYPADMKAGDELPDAHLIMDVTSGGVAIMTMNFDITNRKVEKAETIETEAGAFPCLMISYKTTIKMGFMDIVSTSNEWLSPNVGMVKSESFDKNGKLDSYRKLSKISI